MKINVYNTVPNRFRNFDLDPIDQKQVERLAHSIDDLGFFSGITARKLKDGTYEIAAGHHRAEAAKYVAEKIRKLPKEAAYVEAVVDDYSDNDMRRIMAIENLTQRGAATGAQLDAVAAFAYQVSYEALTDRGDSRGFARTPQELAQMRGFVLRDGPGYRSIYQAINGFHYTEAADRKAEDEKAEMISTHDVRNAVQQLKEDGLMAEIVARALAVVEHERAADEAIAKQDRERAEQAIQAEADRQRRAEEAERARIEREAERARKEEEAARKRKADAAEQERLRLIREEADKKAREQREADRKAEQSRLNAEAERRRKAQAAQTAKETAEREERRRVQAQLDMEKVYDIRCTDLFKGYDPEYAEEFRKSVTSKGAREIIPRSQQYEIAQKIVEAAKENKTLTGRKPGSVFVSNFIVGLIEQHDQENEEKRRVDEAAMKNVNQRLRVDQLWNDINHGMFKVQNGLKQLVEENRTWDKRYGDFPMRVDLTTHLGSIEKLTELWLRIFPDDPAVSGWAKAQEKRNNADKKLIGGVQQ